jgi:hypothetical protein
MGLEHEHEQTALLANEASSHRDESVSLYEREAVLLMHYLDHVFYVQFPFYQLCAGQSGRLWLLSSLTSHKSAYYATLAVSALDIQNALPQVQNDSVDVEKAVKEHQRLFDKGFSYLEREIGIMTSASYGSCDLKMVFDVSMAVIQLITYEVRSPEQL